ncbi:hypothetical protein LR48_Vigan477s000200 [Vigna angularis]|uniref:Uncharacterized protein n=1 Tax=Phaseolus angularis TaxID=3914 RepID=A0A0L9TBK4_PHAAN|nr:hypothetical protein LR48_Vigan477s000200 [Vigna angularis]
MMLMRAEDSRSGDGFYVIRVLQFGALFDWGFGRRCGCCSCASMEVGFSASILSPPVSISPRRSQPKSPEKIVAHHSPLPPPMAIRRSSSLYTWSSPLLGFGHHMLSSSSISCKGSVSQSSSLSSLSLSLRKNPNPNPDGESSPKLVLLEKTQSFGSSKSKSDIGSPRLSNASFTRKSSDFSLSLDQSPTIFDVSD